MFNELSLKVFGGRVDYSFKSADGQTTLTQSDINERIGQQSLEVFQNLNRISGSPIQSGDGLGVIIGPALVKWCKSWNATDSQINEEFTIRIQGLLLDMERIIARPITKLTIEGDNSKYLIRDWIRDCGVIVDEFTGLAAVLNDSACAEHIKKAYNDHINPQIDGRPDAKELRGEWEKWVINYAEELSDNADAMYTLFYTKTSPKIKDFIDSNPPSAYSFFFEIAKYLEEKAELPDDSPLIHEIVRYPKGKTKKFVPTEKTTKGSLGWGWNGIVKVSRHDPSKVIKKSYPNKAPLDFEEEFEVGKLMDHPNIAKVGRLFIKHDGQGKELRRKLEKERVKGLNLWDYDKSLLEEGSYRRHLSQSKDCCLHLFDRGIVWCDLWEANICYEDGIKFVDFGGWHLEENPYLRAQQLLNETRKLIVVLRNFSSEEAGDLPNNDDYINVGMTEQELREAIARFYDML